jgi:phosphoglycolate phosphatase
LGSPVRKTRKGYSNHVQGYVKILTVIYQAVLFDLDGTLLDTLQDIADSANRVLARMGLPGHGVKDYKYFVGSGMQNLARQVLPENLREQAQVAKLALLIEEEYSRHWMDHTRPYPGIPELLEALSISGIRMAVLSNKPQKAAEHTMATFLSRWHFEIIAGAQAGVPLKPDPTAALQIAGQLGLDSHQFLYLGDSAVDMKTAAAAEMWPIGALWGFRTAEELLSGGAKAVIEQPSHLLQFLDI